MPRTLRQPKEVKLAVENIFYIFINSYVLKNPSSTQKSHFLELFLPFPNRLMFIFFFINKLMSQRWSNCSHKLKTQIKSESKPNLIVQRRLHARLSPSEENLLSGVLMKRKFNTLHIRPGAYAKHPNQPVPVSDWPGFNGFWIPVSVR